MSKLLIRVNSPEGTKRIELTNESIQSLFEKISKEFAISSPDDWNLFLDRNKTKILPKSKKLASSILKHGDMIYLLSDHASNLSETQSVSNELLEEDEVDRILSKQDGKIKRKRDDQLCHHGPQAQCINCADVEPYDQEYLSHHDPPIKYVSFHAYIKKLQSGVDRGKYVNLENLNCKIKPGCKEHPPWPKGICNKCQPNAVYLNRQTFRQVDNIMFENPLIVDRFLNYWRNNGHQRIGFLYGRYEPYEGVPLGIRATVTAIYEPPQETSPSNLKLILPDPNEEKINKMAKKLGLTRVGWIFTDLISEDTRKGTVKNFRGNTDSHFLSAEECIMAAYFQNIYKNQCKFSSDNHYGSKFVTVVVTGDSNNQIHFEGYQVSNQCMSLVRDNCLIPTHDAPELAYIKESSNEQFVPDVYYREKDTYNNEVTKIARPLPVEYLLVDLPAAFPKDPIFRFNENLPFIKKKFNIENRNNIHEAQDFNSLSSYIEQFQKYSFLQAMSDFHLLVFLATNETVSFDNSLDTLIKAIVEKDEKAAHAWSQTPEWLTVEHFIQMGNSHDASNMMDTDTWSCKMCTFMNPSTTKLCNICQTKK